MDRGPFQEGCCKQELIMEKRKKNADQEKTGEGPSEPSGTGEVVTGANCPQMLQDCHRGLSRALANTPGARRLANEAAQDIVCLYPYSRTDLTKVH
jgi:hypothetical protein